jgi:toxin secretion/phage lysis holin
MRDQTTITTLKSTVSLAAAGLAALFGGWDMLLTTLVIMVIADYLSGLTASGICGTLDSRTGWRGILKKLLIFVTVAVAAAMDTATGLTGHPLRAMACLFYIGNEGISIVENLGRAGVPIPHALASLFQRLKEDNNQTKS